MKAAVYHETGPPDVFRYTDVPDPEIQPGFVLVDVEAISIEGGDVLGRAGGEMPHVPHIVGYQCAGTIREVGEGLGDREVGQRVVGVNAAGSHAELALLPALTTWVLPDGADVQACATVPVPFGTADDCLFEFGRLREGETALIHAGAGGVGIAAVQLAKRAGARVLATASRDDKLQRLKEFGLDEGINYVADDFVDAARRLTDGRGVDVIVDPVGGRNLERSLAALAPRGRVSYVGNAGRERGTPIDVSPLLPNNAQLSGVFLGGEIATPRVQDMIARHVDDVAAGRLQMPIDQTFPLSDAAAAHAHIESRRAFGRVLLIP